MDQPGIAAPTGSLTSRLHLDILTHQSLLVPASPELEPKTDSTPMPGPRDPGDPHQRGLQQLHPDHSMAILPAPWLGAAPCSGEMVAGLMEHRGAALGVIAASIHPYMFYSNPAPRLPAGAGAGILFNSAQL